MKKDHKFFLIFLVLAFLCWGRLLFLKGIWWDDWAWVWHYFGSGSLSGFMAPFISLRHPLDGILNFLNFKLLEIIPYQATNVWSVWKFVFFTLNPVLLYFIFRRFTDDRSILPETIAVTYLVSPMVNNLCTVELGRRIYIFLFLLSILLSIRSAGKGGIKMQYFLPAILFSAVSICGIESLFFFELARPFIMFHLFNKENGEGRMRNARKAALYWAPFFIAGFLILFYNMGFTNKREGVYAHAYDLSDFSMLKYAIVVIKRYCISLFNLLASYIFLFVDQSISVKQTCFFIKQNIPLKNYFFIMCTAFSSSLFMIFTMFGANEPEKAQRAAPEGSRQSGFAAMIGALLIMLGLFPYMVVRGEILFGLHTRHAILASIGFAVFLPSSLLWLYCRGYIRRTFYYAIFGMIIFLGVFNCNAAVKAYSDDWREQRSFWAQFIRKVPGIKDKLFLVVDMPRHEKAYFSHWRCFIEFSGPLNLLYATSKDKYQMNRYYAESLRNALDPGAEWSYVNNKDKEEVGFGDFKGVQRYYPKNLMAALYSDGRLYINDEIISTKADSGIKAIAAGASPGQIAQRTSGSIYPFRRIMGIE